MSHFIGTIKLTLEEGEGCEGVVGTVNLRGDIDPSVKDIIERYAKALAFELNDLQG